MGSIGGDVYVRGCVVECVCAEGEIAAQGDVLSGFAISDGAPEGVGAGEGEGVLGQTENVDLESGEFVPERGLHEGRKGGKLDDGHIVGGQRARGRHARKGKWSYSWHNIVFCNPSTTLMPWQPLPGPCARRPFSPFSPT